MREEVLYPLFANVASLTGVGARTRALVSRLTGGERVLDLVLHLPSAWIERQRPAALADVEPGQNVEVRLRVRQVRRGVGRRPTVIRLADDSAEMNAVFFRGQPHWIEKSFPVGEEITLSGVVQSHDGMFQMLHPDIVAEAEAETEASSSARIACIYPLCAGLTQKALARLIAQALDRVPEPGEWIDQHLLARRGWPSFREALERLHRPTVYDADAFERARHRLAYDEAFARETAMGQARQARDRRSAAPLPRVIGLERQLTESLPFRLTQAQRSAIDDIASDMSRHTPMRRMLQGDVGSGKSLVAAFAAAQAAAAGSLTAVMSPTDVLARQQAEAYRRFLEPIGFAVGALTGKDRPAERRATLQAIADGRIQLVSGTQALYQADVDLARLALVIIDEQHRFGVADRLRLTAKGRSPHMLVMSATPIPRTLALAFHGDLDMTLMREKPANRPEIVTRAVPEARTEEVMDAVSRAVREGDRAFWICPAVDSEEAGDGAAIARRDRLAEVIDGPVELVHGRQSAPERDSALDRFRSGRSGVLVATTVIEVGIDVPEATIIVIERAERFGLSQLHQLRGRVGRGDRPSSCILLYRPPLTEQGRERLDILRATTDGFEIAEADFRLRGAGDVLGVRQSGEADFRLLDLNKHADMFAIARKDVALLLAGDPHLASPRGISARRARDLFAPRLTDRLADGQGDES
jgi:ATP-dependent DNA helicase RecG